MLRVVSPVLRFRTCRQNASVFDPKDARPTNHRATGLALSEGHLQLTVEASEVLGLVLRRSRRFNDPALIPPSAALGRWRITGHPSPPPSPSRIALPYDKTRYQIWQHVENTFGGLKDWVLHQDPLRQDHQELPPTCPVPRSCVFSST